MRAFELVALAVPSHFGYVALAGLVGLESMGVPVPGETALLAAGILAQQGHLKIELVIAVAAGAAVAGDNLGYLLGRKGAVRCCCARARSNASGARSSGAASASSVATGLRRSSSGGG